MVQAGERIIFKGDIVTPDKFLILNSLKKTYETKQGQNIDRYMLIIGKLIVILACILILILYLAYFRNEIFKEKRHLTFIMLIIVLMTFTFRFILQHDFINIYVVPFAILPILLRIFRITSYNVCYTKLLRLKKADVAIEFTIPKSAVSNYKLCFEAGVPVSYNFV